LAARERTKHLLAARVSASAAGVKVEEAAGRLNLRRELTRFIEATEARGSNEAALVYRAAAEEFLEVTGRVFADEITTDDISRYQRALRRRALSDRTIANHHGRLLAFLRHLKLDVKGLAPYAPKYEEPLPEIYSKAELKAFFGTINDEHLSLVFELLLKTGMRDQEAIHLRWSNIAFDRGVLRVRSNPEWDFKVKDSDQRDIPVPVDLLDRLKAYRETHSGGKLVAGTASGSPDTKLLRKLKRLVKRAGLNCGECKACVEREECEHWYLHKFRATYITALLRSGMDIRTVMKLSGHADLASVMRYLSPADDAEVQNHVAEIAWM